MWSHCGAKALREAQSSEENREGSGEAASLAQGCLVWPVAHVGLLLPRDAHCERWGWPTAMAVFINSSILGLEGTLVVL